jgi:hypothetical protein
MTKDILTQLDLLYLKRGSTICYIYYILNFYLFLHQIEYKQSIVCPPNEREPKRCWGSVFNSKSGCFANKKADEWH